jgi:hypothetical protein
VAGVVNDPSMNYYNMWVNLKDSRRDVEWAGHVKAYLDHLKDQGKIEGWRLTRRKFGFGPAGLGEFHVCVWTSDLAQLDAAFSLVATRSGEVERLHAPVYSMVTDFVSGLTRDFPDAEREGTGH